MNPPSNEEVVKHAFAAIVDAETPTLDPAEHNAWQWCSYEYALSRMV